MKTLVWVEHDNTSVKDATLAAVTAASQLGEVHLLVAGSGCAGVAAEAAKIAGVGKVHLADDAAYANALAENVAPLVADLMGHHDAFVAPATTTGKNIAPRVAALLDVTIHSDITTLASQGGALVATRAWLGGKALAQLGSQAPVFVATTRPNVFAVQEGAGNAEVVTKTATAGGLAIVSSVAAKQGGKLDVKEAPVVVSGGRGMKGPEHFQLIEELAASFGNAATGASRAVVDAGWRPHGEQVGQTGKTVAPQLYIAVGISGAIQHLAGMRTSKVIVAINKDADAPIFKVADYGIVGDAFEILPALTKAVRELKAQK